MPRRRKVPITFEGVNVDDFGPPMIDLDRRMMAAKKLYDYREKEFLRGPGPELSPELLFLENLQKRERAVEDSRIFEQLDMIKTLLRRSPETSVHPFASVPVGTPMTHSTQIMVPPIQPVPMASVVKLPVPKHVPVPEKPIPVPEKPIPVPEPVPVPKPVPVPELKLVPVPELKPVPVPELKPVPVPELKPVPVPEPVPVPADPVEYKIEISNAINPDDFLGYTKNAENVIAETKHPEKIKKLELKLVTYFIVYLLSSDPKGPNTAKLRGFVLGKLEVIEKIGTVNKLLNELNTRGIKTTVSPEDIFDSNLAGDVVDILANKDLKADSESDESDESDFDEPEPVEPEPVEPEPVEPEPVEAIQFKIKYSKDFIDNNSGESLLDKVFALNNKISEAETEEERKKHELMLVLTYILHLLRIELDEDSINLIRGLVLGKLNSSQELVAINQVLDDMYEQFKFQLEFNDKDEILKSAKMKQLIMVVQARKSKSKSKSHDKPRITLPANIINIQEDNWLQFINEAGNLVKHADTGSDERIKREEELMGVTLKYILWRKIKNKKGTGLQEKIDKFLLGEFPDKDKVLYFHGVINSIKQMLGVDIEITPQQWVERHFLENTRDSFKIRNPKESKNYFTFLLPRAVYRTNFFSQW